MDINDVYSLATEKIISDVGAVDNLFVRQLIQLAVTQANQLKMVSLVLKNKANNRGEIAKRGVSPDEKSIIDIAKLTALTQFFNVRTLSEEIANYRAHSINLQESRNQAWVKNNENILFLDYILSVSLCYIEVFSENSKVDKFLATRNSKLALQISGGDSSKMNEYADYLQTYAMNLESRQLKVLKVNQKANGFSITKPRSYLDFNKSVKVTPLFLMTSFIRGLNDFLSKEIIKFTYIEDNLTERELCATFNLQILCKYYEDEYVKNALSNCGSNLTRGYIRVPEIGLSKYDRTGVRALNIARITKIEVVNDFDPQYIDVDFNTIVPSFKESIMALGSRQILSLIYKDIVGSDPQDESIDDIRSSLMNFVDVQCAVGSTTALRYMHRYMKEREKVFTLYNGGKPFKYESKSRGIDLGVN